jgi:ABC-2 type transport system permease protein
MHAPAVTTVLKYRRWLPYVAVLQTDIRQTFRNWGYRLWVLAMLLAAFGYITFRLGTTSAGFMEHASIVTADLIRWLVMGGSVAVIAALSVGAISAERGTLADSVLSRAISRHQYFMAKWHGRLASILGTVVAVGLAMIVSSRFLLHDNLTLIGSLIALVLVCSMLMVVVSGGVMLSALVPSTRVSMTVLWVVLYGGGLLLELLPKQYPTPDRILRSLPNMFMGEYDSQLVLNVLGVTAAASCLIALVGLVGFSRRDV